MIENDKLKHKLKYLPDEGKDLRKQNIQLREQVDYLTHQVKREMDLIKSESVSRYKKEQQVSQQYLESQIQKLAVSYKFHIHFHNFSAE